MKTPQSPAPVAGEEDAIILEMCKAHDREESAQKGEPSPWDERFERDFDWEQERFFAMREAFDVAKVALSRPASEQPVEAIGAGREEIARIVLREELRCLKPDKFNTAERLDAALNERWGDIDRAQYYATADAILAALSPASPARTPMGDEPFAYGWFDAGGSKRVSASMPTVDQVDEGCTNPRPLYSAPTPMGEPVAWIERQNDGTRYGEPKRWPPSDRARSYAQEMGRTIEPLYAAASPARTPMGEPQVLKGVGKINGDGWKDTTSIGEVVYVWNAEKPSPYAPGQYPRIDNEGWSASTAQYDFSPASVDEVRALAAPTPMGGDREHSSRCWGRTSFSDEVLHCYCQTAPTPMGGDDELKPDFLRSLPGGSLDDSTFQAIEDALDRADAPCRADGDKGRWLTLTERIAALAAPTPMGGEVEALREALRKVDALARSGAAMSAADYSISAERLGEEIYKITTPVLAASSPSPAQGGEAHSVLPDDVSFILGALRAGVATLKSLGVTGGARIGMMRAAIDRLSRYDALSPLPQPEAGEAVADIAAERHRQVSAEGWTPEHDDHHATGELARAAGCYAFSGGRLEDDEQGRFNDLAIRHGWPWAQEWWKPKSRRADLVRAGALIVAEIERLDRAAPPSVQPVEGK